MRAGRSTWIFETDAETFQRAGLEGLSEQQSADRMAEIFGWFLDGHPLLINRSMWRNFPMIRSQRWVKDNMVLLGDAKATAHFSIGSGTKLAMEDAIALADAMAQSPTVDAALQTYEHGRREEVEKIQHAADVSLVWFEHVDRFWDFDPVQFAFGVMTRAKAITYDNLTLRAPEFVREVDTAFAKQVRSKGFDVDIDKPAAPMFQPLKLREMEVANRAVVSPMCMYSAKEGVPGDFHLVHYGSRAIGGAGLIFTEMTCVGRDARITPGCTGLWNDEQQAAWTRIVDFVHANSAAKICLQLGHAGRKGATKLMWEGMDRPLEQGGWDTISASPLPYFPDSQVPREMDRAAMDRVKQEFVAAALRGEACGFDMLELHCAHGYLLASFISPLTNTRTDEYGGSLANRLRYPLEVFDGDARGMAGAQADVGAHLRDRLGRGRHHRRRRGGGRARVRRSRRRSGRCLHGPDRARRAADLRPDVPDAILRSGSQRSPGRDHVRREHHHRRPGQHDFGRRPRRPRGAGPAASGRSVVYDAGGGLVRRRYRLSAAISAGQGTDLPQQRARPAGFRGPQN